MKESLYLLYLHVNVNYTSVYTLKLSVYIHTRVTDRSWVWSLGWITSIRLQQQQIDPTVQQYDRYYVNPHWIRLHRHRMFGFNHTRSSVEFVRVPKLFKITSIDIQGEQRCSILICPDSRSSLQKLLFFFFSSGKI